METGSGVRTVRSADLSGPDARTVSRLVEAYLMETEREKAAHLGGDFDDTFLPDRYRDEIDAPEVAYRNAAVYIAELGHAPAGVVVVQKTAATREIKRFWVEPDARGHRVGSALMDAAMQEKDLPIRLTVWDWRDDPIRMYAKRGFIPVPSWEDRPRLLCMETDPA